MKTASIVIAHSASSTPEYVHPLVQKNGFRVQLVERGTDVISLAHDVVLPDLIVMEDTLRDPDVRTVCRSVKANPKTSKIPVLILSSDNTQSDDFLASGCDDLLFHPVNDATLAARVGALIRLRGLDMEYEDTESVLYTLTRTIEAKDSYTMGHADRVAAYAVDLGRAMGASGRELLVLRKGGMLHDIGKIAIPDAILMKPGTYTAEEFSVMKRHPILGCEICEKLRSMADALPLIRHHHERLDGTGYPDGLQGDQISPAVRIVTIVDIYDALRTKRAYKEAFSIERSFEIMWEEANKGWWDKTILSAWEKFITSKKAGSAES